MHIYSALAIVTCLLALSIGCQSRVIDSREAKIVSKVFNYQGPLMIKDDRTGDVIKEDDTIPMVDTTLSNGTSDGAICWNLIVDQSAVTFALQNRVLDELFGDMKDLPMENSMREAIKKLADGMRSSMNTALDALKVESPEDYFDALFDTSEGIVAFSSLIRDPKLEERVFLVLVKAVSRLGRNNSALIQDFIDNCSTIERSQPRPRRFSP